MSGQLIRMDDTDVTKERNKKRMNAYIGSQKGKNVRSNVASNLSDIMFWYFSPNKYVEKWKKKCRHNH